MGLVCPILSIIPLVPKSGEQDVHIAPIEADAKRLTNASILLGKIVATLSPGFIPISLSPFAIFATFFFNCPLENSCLLPCSSVSITAIKSSSPCNKFSAKFNLASGKNFAPVIGAILLGIKLIEPGSPTIFVKSHTALQNSSLFFIDQVCNS